MTGRVCEGLRVLDIASYIAGPVAGTIMADFGADVIKVEAPGGDPYRTYDRGPGMPRAEFDYSWMADNRSKRGICLDLKQPAGQEILHKLVADADVLITNFPLPVRAKLKLRYEDLRPYNPRLIYASMTAYGEQGAEADKAGFDSTALWARSGLMDLLRSAPELAPTRSTPGMGDHPTGASLFGAIMMGLYHRERTGEGSQVSTSLVANGAWWNTFYIQAALVGAEIPPRPHRDDWFNALANHYTTRDGRWFILAMVNEDKQADKFFHGIGRAELLADDRFKTTALRRQNARALIAILDEEFKQRDWAEWRLVLEQHGITFGVVNRPQDVVDDRVFADAGAVIPVGDPEAPVRRTVGSPVFMLGQDKVSPRRPPAVGEHNAEVLSALGYDESEIERLRADGVVRSDADIKGVGPAR